jgi:DNA-binding MarR family transcriptional regulator
MQQSELLVLALREWIEVFMSRSVRGFIRYSKEKGLSMSQLGALFHIHHEVGGGVTGLGDKLGVTSAAASQMLERLVQQELIQRTEDPVDRRVKQLVLTEKGIQTIHDCILAREDWLDELAKTFSDGEKAQVVIALTILIDKAKRMEEPSVSTN